MIKTHTACKGCVFGTFEGKTQTDCKLGKIDKFRENGNEIVEVFDEEKEFYVIDGRKCQFYRNSDWLFNIGYEDDEVEILKEETTIGVDIVLLVEEKQTFSDIQTSLLSIEKSTIKPESIIIVLQNTLYQPYLGNEAKIDHAWIKSNITIPYIVEYAIPTKTIEECINIGAKHVDIYYLCMIAGKHITNIFIEDVNEAINDKMWPILYIEGIHYHQMFVKKSLHNLVGGFGKKMLHDKVLELKEESKCKNTFLTYEQI
jgi:hypothetical protein